MLHMLADGSLTQTTVRLLAPHLTSKNSNELLAGASCKSKRQVEEMLARWFPRPAMPPSVRKLPAPRPAPTVPTRAPSASGPWTDGSAGHGSVNLSASALAAPPLVPSASRSVISPLAADRYEIRFTASAETREKLRLAQDLLRHAVPTGDPAEIIDRALTLLVEELARRKFAATDRPRASGGPMAGSRHVAAKVRRKVWLRDGGRCAFIGKSGRRCSERGFLEFHHLDPDVLGGAASVDNIALRCRAHNGYEARLWFGPRPGTRSGTSSPTHANAGSCAQLEINSTG